MVQVGTVRVKRGMAEMQKGGVIMDVINAEQAKIAEEAGGVATPADAALMMALGADGVFVGSGIFKSQNPEKFARAIVEATTHYQDYELIARVSKDLGSPMTGIEISKLADADRMQERGW